ncbi:MAG: zinc ABC transporter substrate-binding protein [Planctomycetes bacterium]|nr:zinc ABC transporter substrate-binding protein [Planctomycetota bacterium]
MNLVRHLLLCAGLTAALPALSQEAAGAATGPLRVVATLPDLADITARIGGERVQVQSLTRGREDLHHVVARPSHLVALSRADVLVQVGLSLEMGFLPGLLENARNPRIRPGQPGFVNVSVGWDPLGVPEVVTRKDGDVHPDGNPHLNLDPAGGRHIAARILAGLTAADPQGRAYFEARAAEYGKELDAAEARWAAAAKAWAGRKIVVYHKEYDYLARRYGLEIVGSIESKPGIPPTPGHVARLVEAMRAAGPVVILTAAWSNGRELAEIGKAAGATVVELPNQGGGTPGAETWIGMQDVIHERLARAFGSEPPKR